MTIGSLSIAHPIQKLITLHAAHVLVLAVVDEGVGTLDICGFSILRHRLFLHSLMWGSIADGYPITSIIGIHIVDKFSEIVVDMGVEWAYTVAITKKG